VRARAGLFGRIRDGLLKTREKLSEAVRRIASAGRRVDGELLGQIEETLIAADFGPKVAAQIVRRLEEAYRERELSDPGELVGFLKRRMVESLSGWDRSLRFAQNPPTVILVVGVNGSGKTTSIAKLAKYLTGGGKKVLLAAADTFRAAATEQLKVWADRAGVNIVAHQSGADPGAVVYDAIEAACARGIDVVIIDTAGRLQTQANLMKELEKIARVCAKRLPGSPHEVLLVLDATLGQNALSQAKLFGKSTGVTGIVLAKLDGTAKGGMVVGMRGEVDIPVKFVGVGEKIDDLAPFDPEGFVDGLFE